MPKQPTPTPNEQPYTTRVHAIDKQVYLALPDDGYMKLTPDQAQQLASQLVRAAREAQGLPVTGIVVLNI